MNDKQIKTLLNCGHSAESIANFGQCSRLQVDRVALSLKTETELKAIDSELEKISQSIVEQIIDDCDLIESDPEFCPDDYAEQSECPNCDSGKAKTTCGACDAMWCGDCDPSPSAQCHTCSGRGYSLASFKLGIVYWENGSPDLDAARTMITEAQELIRNRIKEIK